MQEFKKSKICPMFNIVKDEDGKYVIAVGTYIASNKKFNTPDQAERYIGTKPWELIVNVMQITLYYNENKKNTKKSAKASNKNAKDAENN